MSDISSPGMNRRQLLEAAGTAVAAVAGLGLGRSVEAAPPAPDQVTFTATFTVPLSAVDVLVIPVSPPIASARLNLSGQADLLGAVTLVGHNVRHLGLDGVPRAITDGVGVLAAANGDALFLTWSGLVRQTATGLAGDEVFTITGGTGRFSGATGFGVLSDAVDMAKKEFTRTLAGTVSAPR